MQSATSSIVATLRARCAKVWPCALSDEMVLIIGFCGFLANSQHVEELVCPRSFFKVAKAHASTLALNQSEVVAVLHEAAQRNVPCDAVVANPRFEERATRVAAALRCTLAEASCAAVWARPIVRVVAVVAMQSPATPYDVLNSLFGSVVRADLRRVEDCSHEQLQTVIDPLLYTQLLEHVTRAALG